MPRRSRLKLPPIDLGKETLGQRLARIRKERGYTQRELADRIGIIQSIVSAYEKDKLRLTAEMTIRFATALDVSTDELLRPNGNKPLSRKPSLKVLRRMKQIESLPPARQAVVLKTIDAFVRASER
jgi:transcriptional regulator with XRE-family HTH domain